MTHRSSHLPLRRTLTGAAIASLLGASAFIGAPVLADPAGQDTGAGESGQPGGVVAQNGPAAEDRADPQAQAASLTWGFRQSFISYVGGHHRIADGVTESNREYTFPVDEVQQDGDSVTLTGRGLVQFAQYCTDPSDTDTCQLDLTLSNPRVELRPEGESAIFYTVRTRNYQSGQVEGPHEVRMATLDLSGARQVEEDGQVSWTDIATTLTEEGAHAFSNFYDPGTALAPLQLTYPGETIVVAAAPYTLGESWNSGSDNGNLHRAVELNGRLAHMTKSSWGDGPTTLTLLDPSTMQPTHTAELSGSSTMAVAADTAGGRLFYYDTEAQAIRSLRVGDDGELTDEGVIPGGELGDSAEVFALGFNPATGGLAALTLDGQGSGNIRFIDAEGQSTVTELPSPVSVSPKLQALPEQDGLHADEFYGSTYLKNARVLEPLPDGSFLYAPGSSVYDEAYDRVMTGHLIQFSPEGADHADQPVREVSDEIFPEDSVGIDMRGLSTSGNTVLRWNESWGRHAAHQVLRYEDGRFTVVIPAGVPADEASELSGMFVDDDGRLAFVDTTRGRVVWLAEDGSVAEELNVPNLQKSAKNNPLVLKLSNGDVIIPQMLENEDYDELIYLQRLVKATAPEPEPEPTPDPRADPGADAGADVGADAGADA